MLAIPAAIAISAGEEWEAGVILAILAFTIVFVVLSILAISIRIMSKLVALRKKGGARVTPSVGEASKGRERPIEEEDLREAAAAIASLHHMLKTAAAAAVLHHHITLKRASMRTTGRETGISPWIISWLNEITYKPELNPYLRRRGEG